MFGRKGQGALEYLLILAAVLAIAVVVILVAHSVATPAQTSSVVNQDKFACAQAGIELVNYNALPEPKQVSKIRVRYQGATAQCNKRVKDKDITASCVIHDNTNKKHTVKVHLATNGGLTCQAA